jgi:hypothetical protein
MTAAINPLSAWNHTVSDIPEGGMTRTRTASADECKALAAVLAIPAVARLEAQYRVSKISGGGYRLAGDISGDVVQGAISDRFDVEYWPDHAARAAEAEQSVLTGPDIEPLEHGLIDAGRIVFECLSAALDPYPRKDGAEFGWRDSKAEKAGNSNPFAVLSKLKGEK